MEKGFIKNSIYFLRLVIISLVVAYLVSALLTGGLRLDRDIFTLTASVFLSFLSLKIIPILFIDTFQDSSDDKKDIWITNREISYIVAAIGFLIVSSVFWAGFTLLSHKLEAVVPFEDGETNCYLFDDSKGNGWKLCIQSDHGVRGGYKYDIHGGAGSPEDLIDTLKAREDY